MWSKCGIVDSFDDIQGFSLSNKRRGARATSSLAFLTINKEVQGWSLLSLYIQIELNFLLHRKEVAGGDQHFGMPVSWERNSPSKHLPLWEIILRKCGSIALEA